MFMVSLVILVLVWVLVCGDIYVSVLICLVKVVMMFLVILLVCVLVVGLK